MRNCSFSLVVLVVLNEKDNCHLVPLDSWYSHYVFYNVFNLFAIKVLYDGNKNHNTVLPHSEFFFVLCALCSKLPPFNIAKVAGIFNSAASYVCTLARLASFVR